MNLLELLQEEIKSLNITDKMQIKNYIYYRTGLIFNYDPILLFANKGERNKALEKIVNIKNVTDFNITCIQWSKIYVELLKEFGIIARTERTGEHMYVKAFLNGNTYIDDLMQKDIMRIKFGMRALNNNMQIEINKPKRTTENATSFQNKELDVERFLNLIKANLWIARNKLKEKDYNILVFKTITKLMKDYKETTQNKNNPGFVVTCSFIKYLIQEFIGEHHKIKECYFYNKKENTYVKVYALKEENQNNYEEKQKNNYIYFAIYSFNNEPSMFSELAESEVSTLIENYDKRGDNLIPHQIPPNTYMHTKSSKKSYYKI